MNKFNERSLWLGYDVTGEAGPCFKPAKILFWKEEQFKNTPPEEPLHYRADALLGLSAIHLNPHLKNPFSAPKVNYPFCHEAWQALEPHHELYSRSQPRVKALRSHLKETPTIITSSFERGFTDVLENCLQPWGVDLKGLTDLIDSIEFLESKIERPLLYNFNIKMSRSMIEKLHYLHSLLFNLRSLVAVDHNSFVQDPSHEAIKVDSITDYLAKAEYVANDALLYFSFKKLRDRLGPLSEELDKAFHQYSHNGYCLIESLPKSFLNSLNQAELEESLYLVQMDWLLGTDAGLLFRIREELYGLQEGYENIFWADLSPKINSAPHARLSISCELTEKDVFPTLEVA